jgi:hypothetical protein
MTHDELGLENRVAALEQAYKVVMDVLEAQTVAYKAMLAHLMGKEE